VPKTSFQRASLLLALYTIVAVLAGGLWLQSFGPELIRIALIGLVLASALLYPRFVYLIVLGAFAVADASFSTDFLLGPGGVARFVMPLLVLGLLAELVYRLNAEYRRSQALALRTEERFTSIFESSAMGIGILDRDGRYVTTNHAMSRMLARDRAPLPGMPFYEYMAPADREANVAAFLALMQGKRNAFQRENGYALPGGQLLWGRLSISLVRSPEGEPEYAVAILEDVTARKHAEEALRKSEERFRTIFAGSAIGVALLNADGRAVESNPALQRMLGYPGRALREMTFAEYTDPQDVPTERALFDAMMAGERHSYQVQKRFLRKGGGLIWARLTASLLSDTAAEAQYAILMVEDITERKEAAEALSTTEKRYRSVVDNIKEVIFQTDAEGVLTLLNPAWEEMTGRRPEESVGEPLLEYVHPDDREPFLEAILPVTRRVAEYQRTTVRFTHRDGGFRWVEVFYQLAPESGEGAGGTLNDITERKWEEEERQRLIEQRENMIATVSHELRAPIAAMMLNFDLLADGTLGELTEEQEPFVQGAIKSILDLAKIVDDLLAVSRLHDGRVRLHLDLIDLNSVMGEVHERMLPRARALDVQLEVAFDPELPLVTTDSQQLAHVVTELVENGIKYSGAGGCVKLRARRDGEGVVMEIADNGRGISDEEKEHIFEPFYRSTAAMREQIPGTGLGLNIVQQISGLLQIQVEVRDTPGGGCTFALLIPVSDREAQLATA
jgi:PAS domain S-box-containing protein